MTDIQAQAGSARLAGNGNICLLEGFKQPLLLLGREANARIAHCELDREGVIGAGDRFCRDHHLSPVRKLEGITHQIGQNLAEPQGIPLQIGWHIAGHVD